MIKTDNTFQYTTQEELFEEFSAAWHASFMELEKGTIISLLRNACMDRITLDERLERVITILKDLDTTLSTMPIERDSVYHNGIKKVLIDLRTIPGRRVEGTPDDAYEVGLKLCLLSRRDVYIKEIVYGPGMDKIEYQLLFETEVVNPKPKDFVNVIYYLDVDRV